MFFASYCGISKESHGSQLVPAPVEEESDLRCLSVREAVNFAKSTNLLGVILEGSTLVCLLSYISLLTLIEAFLTRMYLGVEEVTIMTEAQGCESMAEADQQAAVPSLVASVKDAGLLLATCGDATTTAVLKQGASDGRTVDAFVHDG